ncbi:MAG: hypothetical protein R3B49_10375 [Phycisphaerales bacterium]
MYESGFRGDVYASPRWDYGDVGVFSSYPYPEGPMHARRSS